MIEVNNTKMEKQIKDPVEHEMKMLHKANEKLVQQLNQTVGESKEEILQEMERLQDDIPRKISIFERKVLSMMEVEGCVNTRDFSNDEEAYEAGQYYSIGKWMKEVHQDLTEELEFLTRKVKGRKLLI